MSKNLKFLKSSSFRGMLCACVGLLAMAQPGLSQAKTITDITGHKVEITDHPKRIILGEGRLIYAIEPLEKEHLFDRLVGWQGEFRQSDAQYFEVMSKKFPQAKSLAVIGRTSADTISPEKVLDLKPDLVIFSTTGHGPGQDSEITRRLRSVGVPIIFVDFRSDPIATTAKSMTILGEALDRKKEAKEFVDYYNKKLELVQKRVANIPVSKRPTVFIDMLAGARPACCHTAGNGNMGAFIDTAGGLNVAKSLLPGYLGDIAPEKLLDLQPDVLIIDGTRGPVSGPGLKMGALVTEAQAQQSLRTLAKEEPLPHLSAVKEGRVHGLWHSYYDSPFNILAIEAMAKWFYPEKFADLNPKADQIFMEEHFTPLPAGGVYWNTITK